MWLNCVELTFQTMLLGLEANAVIGLRLNKIAMGGPAAMLEAHQMVAEDLGHSTKPPSRFSPAVSSDGHP